MPNRTFSSSSYRYGFNGKEKDDETTVDGGDYDFGSRIYDSRLGRWLSLDPMQKKYSGLTPYNYTFNNPTAFIDEGGKDGRLSVDYEKKNVTLETTIYVYGGDESIDYDQLVKDYNNQFAAFDNSKKVKLGNEEWTVTVNVKFVKATQIDEKNAKMGLSEINKSMTENIPNKETFGFIAGDNTLLVNKNAPTGSKYHNGIASGLGYNEAMVATTAPTTGIHEVLHLLGFIDRYDTPTGLIILDYSGDAMSSGDDVRTEIADFHFVDLLTFALNYTKTSVTNQFVGEKTEVVPNKTVVENGQQYEIVGGISKSSDLEIDSQANVRDAAQNKADLNKSKQIVKEKTTPKSKRKN